MLAVIAHAKIYCLVVQKIFLFDLEHEENRHDEDQNKKFFRINLSVFDSLLKLRVCLLFVAQIHKYMSLRCLNLIQFSHLLS